MTFYCIEHKGKLLSASLGVIEGDGEYCNAEYTVELSKFGTVPWMTKDENAANHIAQNEGTIFSSCLDHPHNPYAKECKVVKISLKLEE